MLTGCEPHRPTGVAVAEDGRVFVSFPFTDYSRPELFTASLVEIVDKGRAQPYPNRSWNRNPSLVNSPDPASLFFNVQSHTIDDGGTLWALDRGRPLGGEVIAGGAKLVGIDLETDRVTQVIPFASQFATENFLNDVRVDPERKFAYVTDTANGGVIVVNLDNGEQPRY